MTTLHKLTFKSNAQCVEFLLPSNVPMTDIEYEPGGRNLIPFGCRMGACGACVIKIVEGKHCLSAKDAGEDMFLETLGFEGPEYRLACQCRIQGEATVEVAKL